MVIEGWDDTDCITLSVGPGDNETLEQGVAEIDGLLLVEIL